MPPRTMTPPRPAAPAPKRCTGPRQGDEAQERMAAQLVAQGEAAARRNIYIGETPPASFQTAGSAAAMSSSLTAEQRGQAAAMATAMEGLDDLESEPQSEPSMGSGVLVHANEIPVPNW